ncbi:ABC transporter ATP-binding protein [Bosea sp. 117]|uniref:ABC transporter ATP-binding protein n=1 Tax=Bosea sp. 117 TaxID=1125973 RepID=UPI00049461A6|nr:ABC transporter ATP-binding protein [Bosea sp. 117]
MSAALHVSDLTCGYGESVVIQDLSFDLAHGEILAVLGKNGMGKSTLLRTIMGFLRKQTGRVELNGRDISVAAPYRIARLGVGYVAQEKALFQDLTVEENIRLAVHGRSYAQALDAVKKVFPFLLERRSQRAGTLSGGEQKMLLMARTLATGARVMLVDEITEGLQPKMVARIGDAVRQAREVHGASFLVVEQHLGFALDVADRYLVIQNGEIILSGDCRESGASSQIAKYLSL